MIKIKAPGKVLIAGEWNILEPDHHCIVAAVDRFVEVNISSSDKNRIIIEQKDIDTKFEFDGSRKIIFTSNLDKEKLEFLHFTKISIETFQKFYPSSKPFIIETKSSELEVKGTKIGFGSSAATVVSIITALLKFHKIDTSRELILKLSLIANFIAQDGKGSGFDIAASVLGGFTYYSRFDPIWLRGELTNKSIEKIINQKWPGLDYIRLEFPKDLHVIVGYVGYSASTRELISKMSEWRKSNEEKYLEIINKIEIIVMKLKTYLEKKDSDNLLKLINENSVLLSELSEISHIDIETPELKLIHEIAREHDAAGKLSGAGGGDIGIVLAYENTSVIKEKLEENKILPIEINICESGVNEG